MEPRLQKQQTNKQTSKQTNKNKNKTTSDVPENTVSDADNQIHKFQRVRLLRTVLDGREDDHENYLPDQQQQHLVTSITNAPDWLTFSLLCLPSPSLGKR